MINSQEYEIKESYIPYLSRSTINPFRVLGSHMMKAPYMSSYELRIRIRLELERIKEEERKEHIHRQKPAKTGITWIGEDAKLAEWESSMSIYD